MEDVEYQPNPCRVISGLQHRFNRWKTKVQDAESTQSLSASVSTYLGFASLVISLVRKLFYRTVGNI